MWSDLTVEMQCLRLCDLIFNLNHGRLFKLCCFLHNDTISVRIPNVMDAEWDVMTVREITAKTVLMKCQVDLGCCAHLQALTTCAKHPLQKVASLKDESNRQLLTRPDTSKSTLCVSASSLQLKREGVG